jgi:histidinol-phosphate aminotransferase
MPTLSLQAAREALSPEAVQRVRSQVAATVERRREMTSRLARIDAVRRVWPSEGNFVLIRAAGADRAASALRDAGVLVRQFPQAPELEGCLRITVGAASENDAALQVLEGLP